MRQREPGTVQVRDLPSQTAECRNQEKIAVFYLPSYSPELNPDELLNADLKQRVTKAAPPRTKMALTRTAIGALRSIQKQPDRVGNYFGQKDVAYAA
ncbi:MAG: transposase [Terracidiphilus sp.]